MEEEWRDVPGFEGLYRVSSHGRVLSLERRCTCAKGTRRVRQRILTPTKGRASFIVKLSRENGKNEYTSVGKLVLRVFEREPREGEIAHFKDGNPCNPRIDNMQWSTYSAVAVEVGYKPPSRWAKRNGSQ